MLVSVVSYTGNEKYNADVKIKGISRWNKHTKYVNHEKTENKSTLYI